MTLLIPRTEHRDTQALQAKLDELLHAHGQANNALTKIDDKEPRDDRRELEALMSSRRPGYGWVNIRARLETVLGLERGLIGARSPSPLGFP